MFCAATTRPGSSKSLPCKMDISRFNSDRNYSGTCVIRGVQVGIQFLHGFLSPVSIVPFDFGEMQSCHYFSDQCSMGTRKRRRAIFVFANRCATTAGGVQSFPSGLRMCGLFT